MFKVPVYVFYGLAALLLLGALTVLILSIGMGEGVAGGLVAAFIMTIPALLLALLTWQVSTGERVNLFELIFTAFTALGQTVVATAFLLLGLYERSALAGIYGVLGVLVGLALGVATTSGLRDRNRVLRGVTTA